jgi:CHAT domain-containing protein/tetratricopeptide (TPR) repeat protein
VSRAVVWSVLLLAICPVPAAAVGGQDTPQAARGSSSPSAHPASSAEAIDRLVALLRAIPERWQTIPAPLVTPSGRSMKEILESASRDQREAALRRLTRLISTPVGDREAIIQAEIKGGSLTEVDLWHPLALVDPHQTQDRGDAAATLEACLQWDEALGRKDALQFAAYLAIEIIKRRMGAPATLPLISTWASLPPVAGEESVKGRLQSSLADVLFRLGEHQKALEAYRNARQLFLTARSQLGQGTSWNGEANVLFRLGANQKALEDYRNARQLFLDAGSELGQGNTWSGEAEVQFRLGERQKALEAFRTARQLFRTGGSQLGQANTWRGEADVQFRLGENQKALEAYRIAGRLFRAVGDPLGQGNTSKGEGDVLFLLGENQKALEAYRSARQLFLTVGDPLGQGNSWQFEANVLFRLGENQKALEAYRKARQLFLTVKSKLGQGNSWNGEADVLFRLGENQKALEAYRNARQLFVDVGDEIGQGNTWLGEAKITRREHTWRESIQAASTAITMFRHTGGVSNQINALLLQARAADEGGDTLTAAQAATEAIHLQSQWRQHFITDPQRTVQDETISQAYDILVPLSARQPGQAAEALRLAEDARARVFLDLLTTGPNRGGLGAAVDLTAARLHLQGDLSDIEGQLRDASAPHQDEDDLRARRRQLDQDLEWNEYQTLAAQQDSLTTAPPLGAAAIQDLTRETGPLLLYYSAEHEVWGFLVLPAPAEILVRPIALSRADLGRGIRTLTRDLANPLYETRASAQARKLWELLVAPFSDHIPAGGPLVLVPHGPLHELPFEALVDPSGQRLFERWSTSVTPSASALAFAQRRHAAPSPTDSFVSFSSGQGLNLPASEVAEISAFFGTDKAAFQPTQAHYSDYEKLAGEARHLLIATRGVHTEGSRSETYLEIQATSGVHDSRLSAAEIATVPLQAELVTLVACDTAQGKALLSDERLDLTRSFLLAHAVAVLATRWKLPVDTATDRFLTDFYQAYRQGGEAGHGLRKDQALAAARRRSRERGDPAQVWAAWVLVGDAR